MDYLTEWQDPEGHACANHPDEPAVTCEKYADGWSFRCDQCNELDREVNGF